MKNFSHSYSFSFPQTRENNLLLAGRATLLKIKHLKGLPVSVVSFCHQPTSEAHGADNHRFDLRGFLISRAEKHEITFVPKRFLRFH